MTPFAQIILGIGGILAGLGGAAVALYVALTHKPTEEATANEITNRVDQMQEERHAWRYERMLQLETYADADQQYHREDQEWHSVIGDLLREAQRSGFLPIDKEIPAPPVPPVLPKPPKHDVPRR